MARSRQLWVIDRRRGEKVSEPVMAAGLMDRLFSHNQSRSGWLAHLIARTPWVSRFVGWLMRRSWTRRWISGFIEHHQVKIHDFEVPLQGWAHFEAFFSRSLRKGARQVHDDPYVAVMPADARYSFFDPLDAKHCLWIKGRPYSLEQLLERRAAHYDGAPVSLARLCPSDYHRFHSPIDGTLRQIQQQPGPLFSVHPWSLRQNFGRLLENRRVLIEIEHPQLGSCLLVAIGATCVGSIELRVTQGEWVAKGQELGAFHFGGSALLIVLQPAMWEWDESLKRLYEQYQGGYEILGSMGEPLALSCQIPALSES